MLLTCEVCNKMDDTVTTVQISSMQATAGNLCNDCKYELNKMLIPLVQRQIRYTYRKTHEWIKSHKKPEYTLAT